MSKLKLNGVAHIFLLVITQLLQLNSEAQWPYLTAVFYLNGTSLSFLCSAIVIHAEWAMSNTRVANFKSNQLILKTGVSRDTLSTDHRIFDIYINPLYEENRTSEYDVTLLRVDPHFDEVNIAKVIYEVFPWHNKTCSVFGYSQNNATWHEFNVDRVNIMPCTYSLRKVAHNESINIPNDLDDKSYLFLCSTLSLESQRLPCVGKLSGAVFCNNVLVGVLSQNNDCEKRYMPEVFADVGRNFEWIRSRIDDLAGVDPTVSHEARVLIQNPILLFIVLFCFAVWP